MFLSTDEHLECSLIVGRSCASGVPASLAAAPGTSVMPTIELKGMLLRLFVASFLCCELTIHGNADAARTETSRDAAKLLRFHIRALAERNEWEADRKTRGGRELGWKADLPEMRRTISAACGDLNSEISQD